MITLNLNVKKRLNMIIWIKHVTHYRFPLKGSVLFFPCLPRRRAAAKGDMKASSGVSRFIMTLDSSLVLFAVCGVIESCSWNCSQWQYTCQRESKCHKPTPWPSVQVGKCIEIVVWEWVFWKGEDAQISNFSSNA